MARDVPGDRPAIAALSGPMEHVPVELYLERLIAAVPRATERLTPIRRWALVDAVDGSSVGAGSEVEPTALCAAEIELVRASVEAGAARSATIDGPPSHVCLALPLPATPAARYCLCLSVDAATPLPLDLLRDVGETMAQLLAGALDAITYMRGLLEEASEGIVLCDRDGRYIDVNDAACEIIGYSRDEMLQLNYRDLLSADEAASRPIHYADLFAGKTVRIERAMQRKDGSNVVVELSGKLTSDGRFIALARDITARRQAEEALRASEARNRALIDSAFDVIAFFRDGELIEVNQAFCDTFGYDADELIGVDPTQVLVPGERERIAALLASGKQYPLEVTGVRRDGTLVHFDAYVTRVPYRGGEAHLVAGRNITERKRAEIELAQLAAERRVLASQIIAAQERERVTIARELHDHVGQMLAVLKMDAQWLSKHANDADEVTHAAARIEGKVDEMLDSVRTLSHALRPSVLDDLGLCCALESLVDEIARGSDIAFDTRFDDPDRLPRDVETALYRVAQESLANMLKHGGANRCSLELHDDGSCCSLSVRHDGAPVHASDLRGSQTMGIISMRERVAPFDGEFSIVPRDGGGTHLSVSIPYKRRDERRSAAKR